MFEEEWLEKNKELPSPEQYDAHWLNWIEMQCIKGNFTENNGEYYLV